MLDVSSNQFITIVEDLEPPVDFQVGNVVSVGGTVVDGEWNASNTSVEITIPIDNDLSLNGGTIQILASVNGEAEQDLGSPVSISGSNLGGDQIVSIPKEELEILVGFGPTAVLNFNASMTDVSGNGPTFGTQSSSTLTVSEIIIESENFPAFYDVNGGTLEASITLNSASDNRTVIIEYNGITEPETNILTTNATTEDNITYRFNLGQQITGLSEPLGISYTFRVTEGGQTLFSSLGVTHIQVLGDNSYTIPSLKFGSNVSDYQIVAIPFELANKNVSAVFEDDLGAYDDSKWRLFHYQGGNNVEKKSGSINPDEGYWLISSATASIDVGAGSVPQATKTNPYQISLSSGWNQIGNPYLFNLSWSEILAYNGNPAGIDTQLTLFNGGFQSGDILRAYRGAFVNSSASITLDIPVIRNKSIQGRKGGDRNRTETIDSDNWIVDIDLKADDLVYQLSGFGMNSDAQLEKDMNDLYTVPRFIQYLEINFQRDEYINSPLTMDVVPTAENFEWNFTVNSNLEGQELALQWDNSYWGDSEKQLLLFDEVTRKTINMREQREYKYNYSAARNFKVLFGDQEYVESNLAPKIVSIDNAYPNPFGDKIFIPIGLPEHSSEYNVTLEIYDQIGRKINDRILSNTSYGYQNIEWDATDYQGNKVSKGIYFVHLLIQNEEKSENFIQRIIYK